MTIAHAARLIGCTPRYLQRIVRGKDPLSVPIAHDLADLLDLDPDALLDREEVVS